MAYLKPDSLPAMQEVEAIRALAIVERKAHKMFTKQKSYVIDSKHMPGENSPEPDYPFNKPFPRG